MFPKRLPISMINLFILMFMVLCCLTSTAKVYKDFYYFGNETKHNFLPTGTHFSTNDLAFQNSCLNTFIEFKMLLEVDIFLGKYAPIDFYKIIQKDKGFVVHLKNGFVPLLREGIIRHMNIKGISKKMSKAEFRVMTMTRRIYKNLVNLTAEFGKRVKVSAIELSSADFDFLEGAQKTYLSDVPVTDIVMNILRGEMPKGRDEKEKLNILLGDKYSKDLQIHFLDFAVRLFSEDYPQFLDAIVVKYNVPSSGKLLYLYHDFAELLHRVHARAKNISTMLGNTFDSEIILKVCLDGTLLEKQNFSQEAVYRYAQLLAKFSFKWGSESGNRVVFLVQNGTSSPYIPELTEDYSKIPLTFARITGSWVVGENPSEDQKMRMMDVVRTEFREILIVTSSDYLKPSNYSDTLKTSSYFEKEIRGCIEFFGKYFHTRNIMSMPISIFAFTNTTERNVEDELLSIMLITANISVEYPNTISNLIVDGYTCLPTFNYTERINISLEELTLLNVTLGFTECLHDNNIFKMPPKNRKHVANFQPQPSLVFVKSLGMSMLYFKDFKIMNKVLNELRLDLKRDYQNNERIVILGNWLVMGGKEIWNCFGFKTYWNELINWAFVHGFEVTTSLSRNCTGSNRTFELGCMMGGWYKDFYFNKHTINMGNIGIDQPYVSYFKDKCVTVELKDPPVYFEFPKDLSGVSFDLTKDRFKSLSPDTTKRWLQLVHKKFGRIEVKLVKKDMDRFEETLQKMESLAPGLKASKEYKYYINLLDYLNTSYVENFDKIFRQHNASGIHFEMQPDILNFTEHFAQKFGKFVAAKIPVGIAFQFIGAGRLRPDVAALVNNLNYVILDVDLPVLFNAFHTRQTLANIGNESSCYKCLTVFTNPRYLNFDYVMGALRAIRYELVGRNQNLKVMARFQWPTIKSLGVRATTEVYIRIWDYVKDFSSQYNFPFFVNDAFDIENGWWEIENQVDLDVTKVREKLADFFDRDTLRPDPEPELIEDTHFLLEYILSGVIVAAVVIMTIIITFVHKLREQGRILSKEEIKCFREGYLKKSSREDEDAASLIFAGKYDDQKYEVRKEDFNIDFSTWIGSGNFGDVYRTIMHRFNGMVAVKVPKKLSPLELHSCTTAYLAEIKILSYVGDHKNIITLLGACTKEIEKGIIFIITEFCEMGSLKDKLRTLRLDQAVGKITNTGLNYDLCRFCEDILSGLQHLSTKKVIHGDLSARNILLTKDAVCKISDFGLSQKLEKYETYTRNNQNEVPWRWLSLESLRFGRFTLKSDIWSLGVLLWEIFTLGQLPYSGATFDNKFKESLQGGMRLEKPTSVTQDTYEQMLACWNEEPNSRPQLLTLSRYFETLKQSEYSTL